MINIPTQQILDSIDVSHYDWAYTSNQIKGDDLTILCLCVLYHNKLVNNSQMSIYCNRYNNIATDINKCRETYHCPFDDKWYYGANFLGVLLNVIKHKCQNRKITFEEYLKYINIGFNKNKNWCVNYIGLNWILPIVEQSFEYRKFNIYKSKLLQLLTNNLNITSIEDVEYNLMRGYCCYNCDGSTTDYMENKYNNYYAPDKCEILKQIGKQLMKYKTHTKHPMDVIKTHFEL